MKPITRRRLLGSAAAASLPLALPAGAEGKSDVEVVQMLIDAHQAALARWDAVPAEVWPDDCPPMYAISDDMDRATEAVCFYRPTTLEGVRAKAAYMHDCDAFAGEDEFISRKDLISGFLAPGDEVKPWAPAGENSA